MIIEWQELFLGPNIPECSLSSEVFFVLLRLPVFNFRRERYCSSLRSQVLDGKRKSVFSFASLTKKVGVLGNLGRFLNH